MAVLKYARNAAVAAAAFILPAHAIAATPANFPAAFETVRAGASLEETNGQHAAWNDLIIPALIVVALGIGALFLLDEDEDDTLPTSP